MERPQDDSPNRYERYLDLARLLAHLRPDDGPLAALAVRCAFSATELASLLVTGPAFDAWPSESAALAVDRALGSAAALLEATVELIAHDDGLAASRVDAPSQEAGLRALARLPRRHARVVDRLTRVLLTAFPGLPTRLGVEPAAHELRRSFELSPLEGPPESLAFLPYDAWIRPAVLRAMPHGAELPYGPVDRLFALTHQIAECWLALIGRLLRGALTAARGASWSEATWRVASASRLLPHLASHLDLLGHMVVADYHPLRVALDGASLADSRAAADLLDVAPALFEALDSSLGRSETRLLGLLQRPEDHPAEHAYLASLQDFEVAVSGFFFHLDRLTSRLLGGPAGPASARRLARITAPLFPALDAARNRLTELADLGCASRRGTFFADFTDDRAQPSTPVTVAETPVTPERLRVLIDACFAMMTAGEITAFVHLFSTDGVVEDPEGSLRVRGAAALGAWLSTFLERFPGVKIGPRGEPAIKGHEAAVPWSAAGRSRLGDQSINFAGEAVFQFKPDGRIGALILRWPADALGVELGYVERYRLDPPVLRPLGVAVLGHPGGPVGRELIARLERIPTRAWVPHNLYREGVPIEGMRWLSACDKSGPGFGAFLRGMSCAVVLVQPADLGDLVDLAPKLVAAVSATGVRRLAWALPAAADPSITARVDEALRAAGEALATLVVHHEPLFTHLLLCQDKSQTPSNLLLPPSVDAIRWTSPRDVSDCLAQWIREELPPARFHIAGPEALSGTALAEVLAAAAQRADAGRVAAERRFRQIDQNNDGALSKDELRSYLHAIGYGPGAVETALRRADRDGNGTLSFDEFFHELSAALGTILGSLATEIRCVTTTNAALSACLVERGMTPAAAGAFIACLGPAPESIVALPAPEQLASTPLSEWAFEHAVQFMDVHILPGNGVLVTRDVARNGVEGVESRLVRPDGHTLLGWRAKKESYVRLRWSEADGEGVTQYRYASGDVQRTLEVRGERLVGITAQGPWPALRDASELLFSGERVPAWMLALFNHLGDLEIGNRSALGRVVCTCAKVTRAKLLTLIDQGHHTMTSLASASRAGRLCGACRPDMEALLHERTRAALLPHAPSRHS